MEASTGSEVILHVFKLKTSAGLQSLWIGLRSGSGSSDVYHTGVQVGDDFYEFGSGGLEFIPIPPGTSVRYEVVLPSREYVEALSMGRTHRTAHAIKSWLYANLDQFTRVTYDLVKRNCNNFSDVFLRFLVDQSVPPYIMRQGYQGLAALGLQSYTSCTAPDRLILKEGTQSLSYYEVLLIVGALLFFFKPFHALLLSAVIVYVSGSVRIRIKS